MGPHSGVAIIAELIIDHSPRACSGTSLLEVESLEYKDNRNEEDSRAVISAVIERRKTPDEKFDGRRPVTWEQRPQRPTLLGRHKGPRYAANYISVPAINLPLTGCTVQRRLI